jgi:hypothetical protein
MTKNKSSDAGPSPETLRAAVSLKLGRVVDFEADAELTSAGLLSVAVLVSSILLSTTVLVAAAIRESKGAPGADAPRLRGPDATD